MNASRWRSGPERFSAGPGARSPGTSPYLRRTLTGNEQVDWLRAPSVALHWTIVMPGRKRLPDAGTHTTEGEESRSSVAVTVKVTISPAGPVRGSDTVTEAGQARTGAVRSGQLCHRAKYRSTPVARK